MSILIWLALVFLCFPYYTCDARSFGVVGKEAAAGELFRNAISKNNDALNPGRVSIQPKGKSSTPNASNGAKVESRFEVNSDILDQTSMQVEAKEMDVSDGRLVEEYVASVSWKVPPKKKGEQEPGFNLDYLPPKTHPPVHN